MGGWALLMSSALQHRSHFDSQALKFSRHVTIRQAPGISCLPHQAIKHTSMVPPGSVFNFHDPNASCSPEQ